MNRTLLALSITGLLAAATAAPATAASPSALDEHYLMSALQGDQFEITGAKIALRTSHTAVVRRLARTLLRDHSKSMAETATLASALGVELPKASTPSQQWELAVLDQLSGRAFDRWYSALEINDHKQDLTEAFEEAGKGHLKAVRKSAYKEVPMLRYHLRFSMRAWRKS